MKLVANLCAAALILLCPSWLSAQDKIATTQEAGNCAVNINGGNNTVSLTCNKSDEAAVRHVAEILNLAHSNSALLKQVLDKLDEMKQQVSDKVTVEIGRNGIANAAPNFGTQTVNNNFAPVARRIAPETRSALISILIRNPYSANVYAVASDNESEQLALDIYETLHSANWTTRDQVVRSFITVGGTTPEGITVFCYGEPVASQLTLPANDPRLLLQEFFDRAGLKWHAESRLATPENSIDIQVGPNPSN